MSLSLNKFLSGLFILICWQAAFAGKNTLADYQPGFYVGAQGGLGWVHDGNDLVHFMDNAYSQSGGTKSRNSEKNKFGGELLVGYSFSPYFSLEVATIFYPGAKEEIVLKGISQYIEYKNSAFIVLGGKAILPLERLSSSLTGWNVFGKLGPVFTLQNKDQLFFSKSLGNIIMLHSDKTEAKIGLSYTLGVGYNFTDHFGVNLSYSGVYSFNKSKYTSDEVNDRYYLELGAPSRNLLTVGIAYKF